MQRVLERIPETKAEFREAKMRMKLKDCQGVRVRQDQHQDKYLEGDKVWYQHQDSNTWLGPVEVFYYKQNKVWLYTNGNVKKAAT